MATRPHKPQKTNYTGKGTKQRSFQLSDAAFKIVEDEATRLGIPNSAALAMILDQWSGAPPEAAKFKAVPGDEMEVTGHVDHSDILPPATTGSFNVTDPANGAGTGEPRVQRMRSKHDDQTNFGIDED